MYVALQGKAHEPLARIVVRPGRLLLPAPALLAAHRRKDAVCLVPRGILARRNDRTNRDVEARHSSESGCLRTKLHNALARRGKRFGIDRIDVAKPRARSEEHTSELQSLR